MRPTGTWTVHLASRSSFFFISACRLTLFLQFSQVIQMQPSIFPFFSFSNGPSGYENRPSRVQYGLQGMEFDEGTLHGQCGHMHTPKRSQMSAVHRNVFTINEHAKHAASRIEFDV